MGSAHGRTSVGLFAAAHIARDVVLGLGSWSLVVLKDKTGVLGPGLGLENLVVGLGLER